jgi:Rad3-related DNA helicase
MDIIESYAYDADQPPPLKKPRIEESNFEDNVENFTQSLGMPPRKVQKNMLEYIHTQVKEGNKFVIDLPTGGGKSALAGFAASIAIKNYGFTRVVYVTSSKSLQKQVVCDFSRWNVHETRPTVVCQFGKGNYYCPERLKKLMERKADNASGILQLSTGSEKIASKVVEILNEMKRINVKSLSLQDDFFTTSYRDVFFDKMKSQGVPEHNIPLIWNEISASGGCDKKKTKCTCRKDLKVHFRKEIHKDLNFFLAKNLECPSCKIRSFSKIGGILVTNMDALFSYMEHAGIEHIINPKDFIIIDEAHNIVKRAQELFEGKTQRSFNASKLEETLKKWSSLNAELISGSFDKKVFYNFPEDDRAVLAFDNKQYTSYYGSVYHELSKLVLNPQFSYETRHLVVSKIKEILDKFNEEEEEFDNITNISELKSRIGHVSNVLGLPNEKSEEIVGETCKEVQKILGDSEKDDCTNNKNKALAYLQAEIAINELYKTRSLEQEAYLNECFKIYKKGEETLENLYNAVNDAHKMMTDVEIASKALKKIDWINDDIVYKKFIPKISKSGISYEMTYMEKSNILHENLWSKIEHGTMLMSATLSHPEKDTEFGFEDFFSEVGLPDDTSCHTTEEVFDSSRMTIYVPPMKRYSYNLSMEEKRNYNNQRIHLIAKAVTKNPLATLVLSNNIEDYKSIIFNMKKSLRSHVHVDYNKEVGLFQKFEKGTENNYVIYGAEKLWTGLNMPGRIGMVVILKPFNKFRMIEETYYTSIFQKYYKETNKNSIEIFNSHYRYNTCRDTIQAAGRVMRKEDDYGVVMFLSDNRKDAQMLKNKYKSSNFIVGKEMKGWPKVF